MFKQLMPLIKEKEYALICILPNQNSCTIHILLGNKVFNQTSYLSDFSYFG